SRQPMPDQIAEPAQGGPQTKSQQRHKAHVQPGNGHQMIGARLLQLLPLGRTDQGAVADKQGQQQVPMLTDAGFKQPLPQTLPPDAQARPAGFKAPVVQILAYVASGIHSLPQQPSLIIKTSRI